MRGAGVGSTAALCVMLAAGAARGDESVPDAPAAPKCHDATFRGIERAFAEYCRGHGGRGVHGSCADWLGEYRKCGAVEFEAESPGWRVVLRLFDCHDPVLHVVPDGKRWRVRELTMRSYMPPPPRAPDLDL
jgi:hypothetical protein